MSSTIYFKLSTRKIREFAAKTRKEICWNRCNLTRKTGSEANAMANWKSPWFDGRKKEIDGTGSKERDKVRSLVPR